MGKLDYNQFQAYIDGLYADWELSEQDYNDIILYILANGETEKKPRDLIQIRRGMEENLPTLAQGELGFTLDKEELYVGGLNGNVPVGRKDDEINVKLFGAKGDGVTDDSQAIRSALSSGNKIFFPDGEYLINFDVSENNSFYTFYDKENVILRGKGAFIKDNNNYIIDKLTDIFKFVRCKNIYVDINYKAKPLPSLMNNVGYLGSSFLYFEESCSFIEVNSIINYARYGVRSGNYTNANYGYCSNFKIRVETFWTGYPVALYLADKIDVDIKAVNIHRALYLAGCENVKGVVEYSDFALATMNVLITNSLTSENTNVPSNQRARGCSNIELNIIDKGSNSNQSNRAMSGIAPQWITIDTVFKNINLKLNGKTDDTSRTLAGFTVQSRVKETRTEYPYNWEEYIEIVDISISGVIDRTKQTIGNSAWGDIFIEGYDKDDLTYLHAPTFSNININDFLVLKKEGVPSNSNILRLPKLKDILLLENVIAKGINFAISTPLATTKVSNSIIQNISSYDTILNFINDSSIIENVSASLGNLKSATLLNQWENFGGVYANAGYFKDSLNVVHLEGFIKNGVYENNTTLFTLPLRYRPNKTLKFPCLTASGITSINVNANGGVNLSTISGDVGSNTWLNLSGISFKV